MACYLVDILTGTCVMQDKLSTIGTEGSDDL
jgi:hypothetical protein